MSAIDSDADQRTQPRGTFVIVGAFGALVVLGWLLFNHARVGASILRLR